MASTLLCKGESISKKMKNYFPILTIVAALMVSCQSNSTKTNPDSTVNSSLDTTNNSKQCFEYVKNKDTAVLSMNIIDKQVTGTLSYHLYEKDKNNGVIAGIVKGDTIIVDYTFQSEGKSSIRQIVWLKQSDKLTEGFGDVEEVDGKVAFKNINKLKFEQSMVFSKTACK